MVIMATEFSKLSFIFLLCCSWWCPVFCLSQDGLALLSLKSAVDGDSAFPDWNSSDPTPCRWSGVSCMNISGLPVPRVVGVALSGKNLRGYIPSELGSLKYLRRLNLRNNGFYGSIPEELFNATSLHSLFLYGNNLSGSLPFELCNLPRLQNLDLSSNFLDGSLPKELRNCKQMQRLILAGNRFSGEIPAGIWTELVNLIQLDLSDNDFNGSIPEDMSELKSLASVLNLSFNHLSGEIPKSLGDLPMTAIFNLRNNNLSGEIPRTGSFENQAPTAFLNNPMLCGIPLPKPCRSSIQSLPESPVSSPVLDFRRGKSPSPGLLVLISMADAAGVAVIGLIIVYIYWKRKANPNGGNEKTHLCSSCVDENSDIEDQTKAERGEEEGELVAIDKGLTLELDELLRASAYVLGKSALGIVYKVVLKNGVPVAVRRLGDGGRDRYREFAGEVAGIGKVKHPNILNLRAFYWASDEKLLISDFISNGSLASALRGKNGQPSTSLPWPTRLKIAKGTARGLAYLHECSPKKFIHGDIKPSNILLDSEFRPYISDFGLDRLINITGNTTSSGGQTGGAFSYLKLKPLFREQTTSYQAPECRNPGTKSTQKRDVYSFGVVLLELLTGKSPQQPESPSSSSEIGDIARWVRKGFEEERPLSDIVDPPLLKEVHAKKEVLAAFHVALACTEADPEIRPRMKTVSENLDRIGK